MKRIYPPILLAILTVIIVSCGEPNIKSVKESQINANIFPDYSTTILPSNIASPNFIINDEAKKYFVKISAKNGSNIKISNKDGNIQIPLSKWHRMLKQNLGLDISIDIYLLYNGNWYHYPTISNRIAKEPLDNYLVYRFINPANLFWREMGIYQRNIENFEVSPILTNSLTNGSCMNCHSFAANNSENFLLHLRGNPGGTVIYTNSELKFVNTKTGQNISPGVYPSWHPNGNLIAFSTNDIYQRFHNVKEKVEFVYDRKSDIILYNIEKNLVEAIPKLSTPDLENIPVWSSDGKYLYYLNMPEYTFDTITHEKMKYSLKRIPYNVETNTWGDIENIISADSIGKSIAYPRISPDNRYIVFCLADYGYFTVYSESSDIAIMDLKTRKIFLPDINSDDVESYPSWSSNGKWIMFNSKRDDGICSRPYFAYFDNGKFSKPFLLPQENALWNFEEMNNINRPELIKTKLNLDPQKILNLVKQEPVKASFDSNKETPRESVSKDKTGNSFKFDQ